MRYQFPHSTLSPLNTRLNQSVSPRAALGTTKHNPHFAYVRPDGRDDANHFVHERSLHIPLCSSMKEDVGPILVTGKGKGHSSALQLGGKKR